MFAHGLISAMLFMLCGIVQHSVHTRLISQLGGLATRIPKLSVFFIYACFASLGLPGLAGFIAEFKVFIGAFASFRTLTLISLSAVVITASYYLWAIDRAFWEYNENLISNPHDLSWFQLFH